MEEALRETFLPDLFQGLGEGTPGIRVTNLPVKHAGMDLPDPRETAPENWTMSCIITGHLVAALRGQEEFQTEDQSACLRKGSTVVRKRSVLLAEETLTETLVGDRSKAHVDCGWRQRRGLG